MKRILVLAQKGGVGKTLIADQMAYSLDATKTPYAFYELDTQGGSEHETNEMDNAEVAVIDTPGYLMEDAPQMAADADVIVIPTRASPAEVPAFERMRDLVHTHAPETPVIIVLNAWNRYTNNRSFNEYLMQSRRDNETLIAIPQSEAVPNAAGAHVPITQYMPRSRVAERVRRLTNAVREAIGMDPEDVIVYHDPRTENKEVSDGNSKKADI